MSWLPKLLMVSVCLAGTSIGAYNGYRAWEACTCLQRLHQQLGLESLHEEQLHQECARLSRQVAELEQANRLLAPLEPGVLRLRAEVSRLQAPPAVGAAGPELDASGDAEAQEATRLLKRVALLKSFDARGPGGKAAELALLKEPDWFLEAARGELDSEAACRQAMANLRWTGKMRFAQAVNRALEQYASEHSGQLPASPSELLAFLEPPMGLVLEQYRIAKPGTVHPPQPNSPESRNAETWALIEKGAPADANVDMAMCIYRGGFFGSGPPTVLPAK